MELHGRNIVAGAQTAQTERSFHAFNPATGAALEPAFSEASNADAKRAVDHAAEAYETYRKKSPDEIANFLERIAAEIDAIGEVLTKRAHQETALPEGRLVLSLLTLLHDLYLPMHAVRATSTSPDPSRAADCPTALR